MKLQCYFCTKQFVNNHFYWVASVVTGEDQMACPDCNQILKNLDNTKKVG